MDNPNYCLFDILAYSVAYQIRNEEIFDIEDFQKEFDFPIEQEAIPEILESGRTLYYSFLGTKFPYTGIHIKTFRRYTKPKSDLEYISLLTFLALKSIIQIKPYQNTKNSFLYSRMAGSPGKIDDIPENIMYWMGSRYRRDKVFLLLEKSFGLVRAYKARGITYSFTLTHEELELALLNKKYKKSRSALTVEKRNAKRKALESLMGTNSKRSNDKLF